jgi:PhnB protein
MKLNTYLQFNGNCEEALKFYEKALGFKLLMLMRYSESPMADQTPKELLNKVMHGRIALGDNVIMASDSPPDRFKKPSGFSINISIDTPEEADRIYSAFSDQAKIEACMPYGETFWAHRFGMFIDQFGVPWMINCEKKA